MKYQLVIQFDANSSKDFEHLLAYERRLVEALADLAMVDGHDFGMGEFNFFFLTNDPAQTFEIARQLLAQEERRYNMRAGYRERDGETYTALWPRGLTGFTVAC